MGWRRAGGMRFGAVMPGAPQAARQPPAPWQLPAHMHGTRASGRGGAFGALCRRHAAPSLTSYHTTTRHATPRRAAPRRARAVPICSHMSTRMPAPRCTPPRHPHMRPCQLPTSAHCLLPAC